ncbi:MAG TPA: SLATT domain-containing protein [Candidatus Limnocylindrales bacterium]|nr:SLATT domain-containing protein [Candidatus Limnocylindrales bacterium]
MAIADTPDGPVQMDPAVLSAVRTKDDVALRTAWQRYLEYSTASDKRKKTQEAVRQLIIVLSVTVVVLAVISTYLSTERGRLEVLAAATVVTAEAEAETMDGLCAVMRQTVASDCLNSINNLIELNKIILIALPLLIAGTLTWMMQFMPGTAWIGYRVGAELVRYQLYLYRMAAGEFSGKGPNDQQELLLNRVKQARRRVDQLGSSEPYTLAAPPDLAAAVKAKCNDERDDGFSPLTVDEYLLYRIRPQREWYIRKLHRNYNDLRNWRASVLFVTGLGAFLVAINLEPWVAVTTSLATAAGIFIDLKMYGRTYAIYHTAVMELDEEVARWLALPQDRKDEPAEISDFVKTVEDILQRERERWMQQAMQSQTASEQSLLRNVNLANSPFRVSDGINRDNDVQQSVPEVQSQNSRATSTRPAVRTTNTLPAVSADVTTAVAPAPLVAAPVMAASAPVAVQRPAVPPAPVQRPAVTAAPRPAPAVRPAAPPARPNGTPGAAPAAPAEPVDPAVTASVAASAPAQVGRGSTAPAPRTTPPPEVPPELDVLPPST